MLTAFVIVIAAIIAAYATITAARVGAAATIAAQVAAEAQYRASQRAGTTISQVGAVGEERVKNQVSPLPPVEN
jgi:uncharacterized protein (UPF0333 family)